MKRRLIAIALAGVLALLAGVATVVYVARSDARALAGQKPTMVWVTTATISRGTTLGDAKSKGLLALEAVPARSVPDAAVHRLGADDLVAMSDMAAGEVLLTGRFDDKDSLGPQALTVPADHVAASVEVEDPQRVGEFVKPGDFVALFFFNGKDARVLFRRVQVLGVGAASERKHAAADEDGADKLRAVLTLSLTDAEAAQLVAAYSVVLNDDKTHLHFALLPANEDVAAGTMSTVVSS